MWARLERKRSIRLLTKCTIRLRFIAGGCTAIGAQVVGSVCIFQYARSRALLLSVASTSCRGRRLFTGALLFRSYSNEVVYVRAVDHLTSKLRAKQEVSITTSPRTHFVWNNGTYMRYVLLDSN